jgi:transposase
MVFGHISPDLKQPSLWLLEQGYLPSEICHLLGVSLSSLRRWERNYDEFGHVIPPRNPSQGRPNLLHQPHFAGLIEHVKHAPEMYLDEMQDWLLVNQDIFLGRTTLHTKLQNAGLTYKLLRRQAAERDEAARNEWMAARRLDFTARQGVWTDETSKDERTIYRHYGRAPAGERATIPARFVRGERYSILPAMTIDGYIATRMVMGSIDGPEFIDFILQEAVGYVKQNARSTDTCVTASSNESVSRGSKCANP